MQSSEEITREIESTQNKASFWGGMRGISAIIGVPIAIMAFAMNNLSTIMDALGTTAPNIGGGAGETLISLAEAGEATSAFAIPALNSLGVGTLIATGALFLFSSYKKWSTEKELPKMHSKLQAAYVVEALDESKSRTQELSHSTPEQEQTAHLNARADNKRWTEVVQSPNSVAERFL